MINKLLCFDFHICAEHFFDRNKLTRTGKKTEINKQCHMMALSIKIIDHGAI